MPRLRSSRGHLLGETPTLALLTRDDGRDPRFHGDDEDVIPANAGIQIPVFTGVTEEIAGPVLNAVKDLLRTLLAMTGTKAGHN